ncbi:MAG: MFS transporter [Candidatus Hadarchaeum sp.]|uniref:MFS transporter n=1 Tax=Candidatus Hadarchaeum sp. TaxID=2883567 RepID=UPI003D123611
MLMFGINSRIVIVGLPQVAAALKADAEQAVWFTQAYMFASTVALLLVGRASDIFGRVKIYVVGFAFFTLGAALSGISSDPIQVIIFRGLQGFGGGIISTIGVTMIVDATPPGELGFFLGLNQSAFRLGAMLGLTSSGVLLALWDWRALFLINVPIGIFGTLWAGRRLREVAKVEKSSPIDWIGFITISTAIASLLFALTFAAYGMAHQTVVWLFTAIFLVAFAVFLVHESRAEYPLFDLALLRIREFLGGNIAQLLNAAAWGAVLLLLSLYLQIVLGLDPFQAGVRLIPFEITYFVVGVISGKLSDRFGCLPFTTSGLAVISLSLFLFSTIDAQTPYYLVLGYMLLFGTGMGIFASPNVSSIMGCVPPERKGVASAFRNTMFNVGYVTSLSLAVLLMSFTVPYVKLTEIIASLDPVLIEATDKSLFVEAMQRTYLWLALLNSVAILPSVLRGKRIEEKRA